MTSFLTYYNNLFPVCTSVLKCNKQKSWITSGIIKSCKTKNQLFKRYKRNPSVQNRNEHNTFRNKLTSVIRVAKKMYFANCFANCAENIKKYLVSN